MKHQSVDYEKAWELYTYIFNPQDQISKEDFITVMKEFKEWMKKKKASI